MQGNDSSNLHIGKNRQLFFDNQMVERAQDLTRVFHTPKAEPQPLIQADKPWERITYFAVCTYQIVHDSQGKWHCWYADWHYDPKLFAERTNWYDIETSFFHLCYATSEDGIHWTKPNLGLHYTEDGQDTNRILSDVKYGAIYIVTPIEDTFEQDATKRFKTLLVRCSNEVYRIEAAHSPDGIHWTIYDTPPCFGTWGPYLNDMMVLNYDPLSRCYIANVRSPYQAAAPLTLNSPVANSFVGPSEPGAWWKGNKRRVFQTESSDFLHWSQPYPIFEPDEEDNLDESFYGMCQTKVGDTHIAFVNLFHECANTMEVRMASSRDGKSWGWANQRQPWIAPEKMSGNQWDSVMTYLGVPPIEVGDEHWVYYAGAKNHHDWYMTGILEGLDHPEAKDMANVGYYLGLAKMRLDGFVSLDTSPHREGILVTRPFFPEGNRLVINAKVEEGGYVDVEVTDLDGKPLPGFSRADCDRFTGDSVRHVVTWNGKEDAEFTKHTPEGYTSWGYYKLNIYMRKASLYSFQSTDDPFAKSSVDPDLSRKLSVRKWE